MDPIANLPNTQDGFARAMRIAGPSDVVAKWLGAQARMHVDRIVYEEDDPPAAYNTVKADINKFTIKSKDDMIKYNKNCRILEESLLSRPHGLLELCYNIPRLKAYIVLCTDNGVPCDDAVVLHNHISSLLSVHHYLKPPVGEEEERLAAWHCHRSLLVVLERPSENTLRVSCSNIKGKKGFSQDRQKKIKKFIRKAQARIKKIEEDIDGLSHSAAMARDSMKNMLSAPFNAANMTDQWEAYHSGKFNE